MWVLAFADLTCVLWVYRLRQMGLDEVEVVEEEEFRQVAARPDVYEVISKSIAPSIYGSENMKKAIACLLFGGSRKRYIQCLYLIHLKNI